MFFRRLQYNSPVILTYTMLSLTVLIIGNLTGGLTTKLLFSIYKTSFSDPLMYFRLVGHVLGHVDFSHYYNNFLIILLVGPMLEEKYGSGNIFIMMLATALITGLLNVFLFNTGLLGASGIVFMFICLGSFANFERGKIPLTAILIAIIFLGKEVVEGFNTTDNISQLTHIAGGICGSVLGFAINTNSKIKKAEKVVPVKEEED